MTSPLTWRLRRTTRSADLRLPTRAAICHSPQEGRLRGLWVPRRLPFAEPHDQGRAPFERLDGGGGRGVQGPTTGRSAAQSQGRLALRLFVVSL